ncbi:hypothetical protein LP414_13055 [Polaromonas sp. P1(28)-13]|nr:hypothetical protein LP414_13055 [Polaromonas sp. P1(28)-13]
MSVLKQMNALTVAAACALCLAAGGSHAEPAPAVEASLAGHAALPATSAVQAPRDAGAFLPRQANLPTPSASARSNWAVKPPTPLSAMPNTRASGGTLPMKGQSVQGFSGIVSAGNGQFLVLTDNGFGNKINSQDALLMVHTLSVNWSKGQAVRRSTTF